MLKSCCENVVFFLLTSCCSSTLQSSSCAPPSVFGSAATKKDRTRLQRTVRTSRQHIIGASLQDLYCSRRGQGTSWNHWHSSNHKWDVERQQVLYILVSTFWWTWTFSQEHAWLTTVLIQWAAHELHTAAQGSLQAGSRWPLRPSWFWFW